MKPIDVSYNPSDWSNIAADTRSPATLGDEALPLRDPQYEGQGRPKPASQICCKSKPLIVALGLAICCALLSPSLSRADGWYFYDTAAFNPTITLTNGTITYQFIFAGSSSFSFLDGEGSPCLEWGRIDAWTYESEIVTPSGGSPYVVKNHGVASWQGGRLFMCPDSQCIGWGTQSADLTTSPPTFSPAGGKSPYSGGPLPCWDLGAFYDGGLFYTNVSIAALGGDYCSTPMVTDVSTGIDWTMSYTHPASEPLCPYFYQNYCSTCGEANTADGYGAYYEIDITLQNGATPPSFPVLPDGPINGNSPPMPSPPTAACYPAPAGIVGWWKGENNANDSSGRGNNGTAYSGTTYGAGVVSNAFIFNGTSGYVGVPNNPSLEFSGPFTVEGWIKATTVPSGGTEDIIIKGQDANVSGDWAMTIGPNRELRPHATIGGTWRHFDCGTTLNSNTWYHVAMVYDGSEVIGYVNGAADGFLTVTGAVHTSSNPVRLGSYSPSASFGFFPGSLDEISVYDRALSALEIQQIYDAGTNGKCAVSPPLCAPQPSGLTAWWQAETNTLDYFTNDTGVAEGGLAYTSGEVGYAFSLNGTNAYVKVSNPTNLQFAGPFSIEGWINFAYLSGGGGGDTVVIKGPDANTAGDWALAVSSTSNLRPHAKIGGAWTYFNCGSVLESNRWYHVALVYDNTNLMGYVDGVLDGSQPATGSVQTSTNDLRIGAYAPSVPFSMFPGAIDELSIYDRALSASEIQSIFEAGSAGKCF